MAEDDDGATYFGEDFGQKIDLTVRIREILRNYPEGTSILKVCAMIVHGPHSCERVCQELIQNADDAGASELKFCLDNRQHASTSLAYDKMATFQGNARALWYYQLYN